MDTLTALSLVKAKCTEITPEYLFGTDTFEEVTAQFPLQYLEVRSNLFQVGHSFMFLVWLSVLKECLSRP